MNIFQNLPKDLPGELVEILCESDSVRVERILSYGHQSPDEFWYDQDENEWVVILQGEGCIEFLDPARELTLSIGDSVLIKAHEKHRVKWTASNENTLWLAVFFK